MQLGSALIPECSTQSLPPFNNFLQPIAPSQVPVYRRINATDDQPPNGYIFIRLLGKGGFGKVYLAKNLISQQFCAVKCATLTNLDPHSKEIAKTLAAEYSILSQMSHKNIVACFGFSTSDDCSKYFLFLEYMDMGSIKNAYNQCGPLQERFVNYITKEVLNGLDFLHGIRIVHRDIKADNILLNSAFMIKIGDFGITKRMYHVYPGGIGLQTKMIGTSSHMAPEILFANCATSYDGRVDIWSLGCTIIELLTATYPQSKDYYNSIVFGEQHGFRSIDTYRPANISDTCWLFIKSTLNPNQILRPNALLLLCDPWLTMMT